MSTTHTARNGPLTGVRVVELAGIGPGPFAAMLLADLGADVVRVDRPGGAGLGVDPARDLTNRNKRSVLVDLKAEDGPATVLDLVERADILVEGYRPGVAERLGVGPEACLARNPHLVYGRMTGWGQGRTARSDRRPAHDIGYIAITGALGMIGPDPDGPPTIPANLVGDYAGGSLYLVIGVLAALQHARTHGEGQVVDAAIVDGTAHFTTMIHAMLAAGGWQDRRGVNLLDGGFAPSTACTRPPTAATWRSAPWRSGSTPTSSASSASRTWPPPAATSPAGPSCGRPSPTASGAVPARSGPPSSTAPTPVSPPSSRCARRRRTRTSWPAPPSRSGTGSPSPPPRPASPSPPAPSARAPPCPVPTPPRSPATGPSPP
ncbi:Formyl-CoA:oxalate CoA-transferase [Streptomyces tanashiensis]